MSLLTFVFPPSRLIQRHIILESILHSDFTFINPILSSPFVNLKKYGFIGTVIKVHKTLHLFVFICFSGGWGWSFSTS